MAKFIAHGIILEEPATKVVGTKLTPVTTVRIEERQNFAGREYSTTLSIEFAGKSTELIPQGRRLAGMVCVIAGNITSHEWQGKHLMELKGDQFTLAERVQQTGYTVPPKAEQQVTKAGNLDEVDIADDDLPF